MSVVSDVGDEIQSGINQLGDWISNNVMLEGVVKQVLGSVMDGSGWDGMAAQVFRENTSSFLIDNLSHVFGELSVFLEKVKLFRITVDNLVEDVGQDTGLIEGLWNEFENMW
jgi:hypothetical protein